MQCEIRKANAAFTSAVGRGDPLAIAGLYTPGARSLLLGGELLAGRREIEAFWRAGIALGVSSLDLVSLELQLEGAVAVEIGRYAVSARSDDREVAVERGTYVVVHRQQAESSWQRAVEVLSPDEPGTPQSQRNSSR